MAEDKEIKAIGKQIAREIGDFIFANSQENLVTSGAIDTSNLFLSGSIEEEGDDIVITYDAPYAQAVNDGTKPHGVDPKVLEGWVRRKINPGSEVEVRKIAFLISRKIKERGTKPNPFMDKAIELAEIKFGIK